MVLLSCKRDQNKIRNYMDRRVTPVRPVTSPTWGPPPPCNQALLTTELKTKINQILLLAVANLRFMRVKTVVRFEKKAFFEN